MTTDRKKLRELLDIEKKNIKLRPGLSPERPLPTTHPKILKTLQKAFSQEEKEILIFLAFNQFSYNVYPSVAKRDKYGDMIEKTYNFILEKQISDQRLKIQIPIEDIYNKGLIQALLDIAYIRTKSRDESKLLQAAAMQYYEKFDKQKANDLINKLKTKEITDGDIVIDKISKNFNENNYNKILEKIYKRTELYAISYKNLINLITEFNKNHLVH